MSIRPVVAAILALGLARVSIATQVTITRDDWGIAHVKGKTDADAVLGMIYAQAEDDFNRVETNYLTNLGRLAEAQGEDAIWKDLRQRLFVDPAKLRRGPSAPAAKVATPPRTIFSTRPNATPTAISAKSISIRRTSQDTSRDVINLEPPD